MIFVLHEYQTKTLWVFLLVTDVIVQILCMLLIWKILSHLVCVIQRKRGDSDINDADCNLDESVKEEAVFEDKIVDMMVLEEPQNMYQSLEK